MVAICQRRGQKFKLCICQYCRQPATTGDVNIWEATELRVLLSSSQSHVGWQWEGGDGSSPGIHGSWLLLSNSLWALRPWILLSMCLSNRRRQKQYVGDPMRSFNVPDWKAENIASAQSPTVRISGIKSDLPLVGLGQASELCARRKDTLVLVALIRIWSFLS